ncbi:MAG: type II toxin-antitoxin system VapC family toxin [Bryobacter sp.]|nr:type II toxin-antitoxin system VapC family toxin [Bryobacter sp.]
MRLVIDSSAILAVVFREEGFEAFAAKVEAADECLLSPVNYWEALTVARNYQGEVGENSVKAWLAVNAISIADVTVVQAELAIHASRRFGGRPARLNLGDCFAYALAKDKGLPLLYKGNDFTSTDAIPA